MSTTTLVSAALVGLALYALARALSPLVSIYRHYHIAQKVGLPVKILPVPPGMISFFAFQVLGHLGLVTPGGVLEKMFNAGRSDGFSMHGELKSDTILTVSALGVGLVTADPKVATYISARKETFPKPPNTGVIINLYGKNVINSRGEQWRMHRKVTGPVFSEKIHRDVWDEATRQARSMVDAWKARAGAGPVVLGQLEDDALRLGLNVITGAAYGIPLGWDEDPPTAERSSLSYRKSMEQLSAHLMPLFLTPHWLLRLAPRWTTWGRAWEAYTAFGGYMTGMLNLAKQKREKGEEDETDNLMTVLTRAEAHEELDHTEVLGNTFIMLFAGHETTANTLHYALLLLALHPEIQTVLQAEIDGLYGARAELDYDDFPRARWITAVMNETLRCFPPTAQVNKWTEAPTAIPHGTGTVVLPAHTRVSTNINGVHANPEVWGEDAKTWLPSRWIVPAGTGQPTPKKSRDQSPHRAFADMKAAALLPTPPPTPSAFEFAIPAPRLTTRGSQSLLAPPAQAQAAGRPGTPFSDVEVLKPVKGAFLPFSDGARGCSGKKFAAVEFCAVLCVILRAHRLETPPGWSQEQVWRVVRGRKAGALTLQPPEPVPIVLVPRKRA